MVNTIFYARTFADEVVMMLMAQGLVMFWRPLGEFGMAWSMPIEFGNGLSKNIINGWLLGDGL